MKKAWMKVVAAALSVSMLVPAVQAQNNGGGLEGFLTGCFLGLRVGADYNEKGTGEKNFLPWFLVGCCFGIRAQEDFQNGKDMYWRDWCRLIPYVNVVFAIWDGIDVAGGKTRTDLQQQYGTSYY